MQLKAYTVGHWTPCYNTMLAMLYLLLIGDMFATSPTLNSTPGYAPASLCTVTVHQDFSLALAPNRAYMPTIPVVRRMLGRHGQLQRPETPTQPYALYRASTRT